MTSKFRPPKRMRTRHLDPHRHGRQVGSEAARLVAQRDEPVRVLVRNPEKATALRQLGAEVADGDLDDSASIDAAM